MKKAILVTVAVLIMSAIAVVTSQTTPSEARGVRAQPSAQDQIVPGTAFYRGAARTMTRSGLPLSLAVRRGPLPAPGIFLTAAGVEQPVHDFQCGPKGSKYAPCDATFMDFCAEVAKGTFEELIGGYGACATSGT